MLKLKREFLLLAAACLSLPSFSTAQTSAPATMPTTAPVAEAADQPIAKIGRDAKPDARFMQLHDAFIHRGKESKISLLFMGDSITEGWLNGKNSAPDIWKEHYFQYDPASFGISGDKTQHVIWRIEHGELDGLSPKVVVLMIGTNNIGNKPEEILAGDLKIISDIHAKLPDSKLLLLAIFPRGMNPADPKVAPMRDKIKQVNAELAKLDDGSKTRYLDLADKFLNADGVLARDIMPDALHPNHKGYQIWADAMQPLLDEMMK